MARRLKYTQPEDILDTLNVTRRFQTSKTRKKLVPGEGYVDATEITPLRRIGLEDYDFAKTRSGFSFVEGAPDDYCRQYKEDRAFHPGKVELPFFSPEQAAAKGTRAGPNLRICHSPGKPGFLIPVGTPEDADTIYKSVQACLVGKAGGEADVRECVEGATRKNRFAMGAAPKKSKRGVRAPSRKKSRTAKKRSKR